MRRYLVVTPSNPGMEVPSGEAYIWAVLGDLGEGPLVLRAGDPLPVSPLDVILYGALKH